MDTAAVHTLVLELGVELPERDWLALLSHHMRAVLDAFLPRRRKRFVHTSCVRLLGNAGFDNLCAQSSGRDTLYKTRGKQRTLRQLAKYFNSLMPKLLWQGQVASTLQCLHAALSTDLQMGQGAHLSHARSMGMQGRGNVVEAFQLAPQLNALLGHAQRCIHYGHS